MSGRDFSAWSFLRAVLEQGMAVQQDYAAGRYPTYEHLSARLDEAARERDKELEAQLLAEREGMRGALEWVPWSPCASAPQPCFHTQYLCTVRRMGTIGPVWLAIRDGHMFDDGTSTEVVAYQRGPLTKPYDAALAHAKTNAKTEGDV